MQEIAKNGKKMQEENQNQSAFAESFRLR